MIAVINKPVIDCQRVEFDTNLGQKSLHNFIGDKVSGSFLLHMKYCGDIKDGMIDIYEPNQIVFPAWQGVPSRIIEYLQQASSCHVVSPVRVTCSSPKDVVDSTVEMGTYHADEVPVYREKCQIQMYWLRCRKVTHRWLSCGGAR